MRHGRVIVVAYPGSYQVILGKANGPVVAFIIAGAGFNSDLMIGDIEKGTGAKGRDAGKSVREDVGENVGSVRIENRIRLTRDMLGGSFGWFWQLDFRDILAGEVHQGFSGSVGNFKNRMEVDF